MINLTFLGTGCWQGIPAPFGMDKISKRVKWGSKDFRFRTSLRILTNNGKTILVEITPDVRLQSWKYHVKKPDICLVSHWHWDHFFGLLDLDWFAEKNSLTVYGNKTTKARYISQMSHIKIDFKLFRSFESFEIDNIKITPLLIDHVEETHGFLFEDLDNSRKIAYLSDVRGVPERTYALLQSCDAIIMDATYINSNIFDDPTHLHKDDIVPFLSSFTTSKIILTSIGSYNGLSHSELEAKFPKYLIAYDGMQKIY